MPKKRNDSHLNSGAAGLQASVIGFVLVGCTAVGFGIGWWLDAKFGTTFWTPALALFGVVAGFVQMMRMVGEINREAKYRKEEAKREEQEAFEAHPSIAPQPPKEKPLFRVPPPPSASWDKKKDETIDEDEPENLDSAALIERWLGEEDEEKSKDATT